MALKKATKFTILGNASKPRKEDLDNFYSCYVDSMTGSWKNSDRNTNDPKDTEGKDYVNQVIFILSNDAKGRACAPEPPFYTDDSFDPDGE